MRIAVVGGSFAGQVTAILLARDGHEVVVLERDELEPAPDVETAAATAFRPGAPQIVQLHAIRPLGRNLIRDRLPDVYDGWMRAGVVEYTLAQQMPPTLPDRSPRPDDDELTILLFRRAVLDWVLRKAIAAEPGVTLRPRVRVSGLTATAGEIPRVTGVTTDQGAMDADLVIDASGRRTHLDQWLDAIGARRTQVVAAECGVSYYTRYYRLRAAAALPGSPVRQLMLPLRRFMVAHFGGDNDTMGLCLVPLREDREFKAVRQPAAFTAVARTVPEVAAWLDVMEPISDIYPMGDLHNTLRRLVVDGTPVAHGILTVGDSTCTTNPTFARGIGFAVHAAVLLVDAIGEYPADELTKVMDEATSTHIAPWFADQAATDAARLAALRSVVHGTAPPPPPAPPPPQARPAPPAPPPGGADRIDLATLRWASGFDSNLFRAQARLLGMFCSTEEVLGDPAVIARVREILAAVGPRPVPEPTEDQLAEALATRD